MVTEARPAHILHVGNRSVRVSPFVGSSTTIPMLQKPLRSLVSCCVVSSRYWDGWSPPRGPGPAIMRLVPAVCRRVHLFLPIGLAVAGSKPLPLLLLLILTCKFWAVSSPMPRQSSLNPCCLQTELPPPRMVLPEEPLSTHGSAPEDALLQPSSYACVNTNMLLNNWVIPRVKAP